jgi:hypothetical protein
MRKEMGLNPNQKVILRVEADDAARAFVEGARPELSKIVSITDIIFDATATKQLSVGPHTVTVDLHVA